MREIKFRYWDLLDGKLKYIIPQYQSVTSNDVKGKYITIPLDDIDLMQYTGLKDKNGKEIYEGDIVKVLNSIGEYECGEVAMGGLGLWAVRLRGLKVPLFEFIDDRLSLVHSTERIKVIGNIYENPELLEVE